MGPQLTARAGTTLPATDAIPRGGRLALMVAHCAGMVDLVALPVWIGALVQRAGLDVQAAGGVVTLFLLGAVVASVAVATRVGATRRRAVAVAGYLGSACAFAAMASVREAPALAALHLAAGLCTGAALSVAHGSIGQSANPHRLFAAAGIALGVFAIVFLGVAAPLAARADGPSLFQLFAGVMAVAALVSLAAFPRGVHVQADRVASLAGAPIPRQAWFAVAGISLMALVQAMVFGFLERAGHERGFGAAAIAGVLVGIGVVNLLPAGLAALLQKRVPAHRVLVCGPVLQAALAATIMCSAGFVPYAAAAAVFPAVMIFTHTFVFGVIGRLDTGGRVLSATPAMLMTGAAIGPLLGGTLAKASGYASLGVAACVLAALAVASFLRVGRQR